MPETFDHAILHTFNFPSGINVNRGSALCLVVELYTKQLSLNYKYFKKIAFKAHSYVFQLLQLSTPEYSKDFD